MIYLRRKGTTTTLDEVGKLVDSGPYAWVRHPQYTAGLVMLLGWFLAWGAWYALGFIPIIAGIIYAQALIEEKYILEKVFGEAYAAYCERVGMLLPRLGGNDSLRITTAFLGLYAGLIAIQHGIFEIMQGSRAPDGLMFNAIGPPCQPEAVWHACFPAMTLIPNLLVTGIAAIVMGITLMLWALFFVQRRYGGWILAILSILLLLVGGGFVPVFIGMVAAIASRGLGRSPARPRLAFLTALWPWPLVLMALWLPGSWLLGHFFGPAMLAASRTLFLVFDIGLPVLAAVSSATQNAMTEKIPPSGYFRNGLPYNRAGQGPKPLVIFQGLMFENKPQPGMTFGYGFLEKDYTLYAVLRKPGLPGGYTLKDMADDYAEMIDQEFGGPLDVIGVSTGGALAQHFAADHPDLLRRLVIHSSAHTLGEAGKQIQREIGHLAKQGRVTQAWQAMIRFILPSAGIWKLLNPSLAWMAARWLSLGKKPDLSDLVITIETEDRHAFKDRLSEIKAPTLVIAGTDDPFYTPALFRETAAGIPHARLVLYEKMRHPAMGKQFERDVLAFLREETPRA